MAIDDKKEGALDELVTLRIWDAKGKQFIKAVEGVKAGRRMVEDRLIFTLKSGNPAVKGSEFTDKDGVVYVITKMQGGSGGVYTCDAMKKEVKP